MESDEDTFQSPLFRFLSFLLNLSSDVRKNEITTVLSLLASIFFALASYYVLKTLREPLILNTGGTQGTGSEWKAAATGIQAIVLIGYVPLYDWISSQFDRLRLINILIIFFILCIEGFFLLGTFSVPYTGFFFYIWTGIFSLSIVAQFWSYANDLNSESQGKRLFPVIAIGATLGAPIGNVLVELMNSMNIDQFSMFQASVVLLFIHLGLYHVAESQSKYLTRESAPPSENNADHETSSEQTSEAIGDRSSAAKLILQNRYLILIAVFLALQNFINSMGEFILADYVESAAAAAEVDRTAFIRDFYNKFYFIVNIATTFIQTFLVYRIYRTLGVAGIVLLLPIVSLGTYSFAGAGIGLGILKWFKTAENSTAYSVMNTAKNILWLPTSREEKYKAKQAIDTFFVRFGDVISMGAYLVGSQYFLFKQNHFGLLNIGMILIWFCIGFMLLKRFYSVSDEEELVKSEFQ